MYQKDGYDQDPSNPVLSMFIVAFIVNGINLIHLPAQTFDMTTNIIDIQISDSIHSLDIVVILVNLSISEDNMK